MVLAKGQIHQSKWTLANLPSTYFSMTVLQQFDVIQSCLYVPKSLGSPHCLWPFLTKKVESKACVIKQVGTENSSQFGVCKDLFKNCSGVCGRRDGRASGFLSTILVF